MVRADAKIPTRPWRPFRYCRPSRPDPKTGGLDAWEYWCLQSCYQCSIAERIVYLAELQKNIPPTALRQQGLDKLAQLPEFTGVLHKEVQARNLDVKDVMACFDHLYEKVSNRTNGNDDTFNDSIIVSY